MTLDTANEGGKHLRKVLRIYIARPTPNVLSYLIEGEVEKIFTMEPKIVRLEGKLGQKIKATVEITPEPKYPFSITGMEAKNADYIRYHLDPVQKDGGRKSFVLTVENLRNKKGRYFDKIYLHTDSPVKPEIAVGVFGFITG